MVVGRGGLENEHLVPGFSELRPTRWSGGSTEHQARRKRFIGTAGVWRREMVSYCSVREWQGEGFQGESVEILKEGQLSQVSEEEIDTSGQQRLRWGLGPRVFWTAVRNVRIVAEQLGFGKTLKDFEAQMKGFDFA